MADGDTNISIAQLGPMPPPHGGVSTNMLAIHHELRSRGSESVIVDVTNRDDKRDAPDVLKPRSAIGLIRLMLKLDCKIVHYHIGGDFSLKLALLTLFCGFLPGKKSVVTFHSGGYTRSAVANARRFSLRGFAFRSVDFLIGVNSQMLEMFGAFGVPEERMRLILPFDVSEPDESISIPSELSAFANSVKPLLIAVGGLEPEYLNSFLIETMQRIKESFPNCGVLIAGSGSLEGALRHQIAQTGLADSIFLAGNIDHEVLLHLINRADVLLRLTEYDGDAISVREAIHLGTPVVATDNGMRPEEVHLISNATDGHQLLAAVSAAVAAKGSTIRNEAIDERNVEKVLDVYRELLAE